MFVYLDLSVCQNFLFVYLHSVFMINFTISIEILAGIRIYLF